MAVVINWALCLSRNKTEKGKLIKLADEYTERVNQQEWITSVMIVES